MVVGHHNHARCVPARHVEDSVDAKVGTHAKVAEIGEGRAEQWEEQGEDAARTEAIEWDFGEHPHFDWCQVRQRTQPGKMTSAGQVG